MSCSIGPLNFVRDGTLSSATGNWLGPIEPPTASRRFFRGPGRPSSLADAVNESASPTVAVSDAAAATLTDGGLFGGSLGFQPSPSPRFALHTPSSISHTGSSDPTAVDFRPLCIIVHTSSCFPKSA